ncbi:MAG: exodeoxyribonuclease VII large subunit [Oscillospiraceae bacterium]|nr:exodeoxyribonuclease VII large subunit [Oscillospiraceae bacterium]
MNSLIMTVTQLNRYVRFLLEGDAKLQSVYISGEISNFKLNSFSGHMYFSLKDDSSIIRCAMFKSDASRMKFIPQDGMKVLCRGRVSLYERDGQYQFYASEIQAAGAGALAIAFEQIKARLEKEGLFDQKYKKPLPQNPQTIAVITSPTGAAVKDIISVLGRRYPVCKIVMCPVSVQGSGAATEIIGTLKRVYKCIGIDLIILGRGGGSAEDLSAFNDEQLARTVFDSPIPIISAVGHETDFTICDFVADLRAPTPSAAAEIAVPDIEEQKNYLKFTKSTITKFAQRIIDKNAMRLVASSMRPVLQSPINVITVFEKQLNDVRLKLNSKFSNKTSSDEIKFKTLVASVNALNPLNILSRGFAVVYLNDVNVKSISQVNKNDELKIRVVDGFINSSVIDTKEL